MYNTGDIVLIKFPFTHLKEFKLRPAIIIGEYKNDLIMLAISSNKRNGINYEIETSNLKEGKMLVKSYIKINKIMSAETDIVLSCIAKSEKKFLKKVREKFIEEILER